MRNDNEVLRQKREREFQTRVLSAVEKPKRSRLLEIINAPFFLWLMSVIVLSVGGTYYTTYKQCVADADKLNIDFHATWQKLFSRQIAAIIEMSQAKTTKDLRELTVKKGDDGKTLNDLAWSLRAASARVDLRKAPLGLFRNKIDKIADHEKFESALNGFVPLEFTDADIPAFRAFIGQYYEYAMDELFLSAAVALDNDCRWPNVTVMILGYQPLVLLRAIPIQEFQKRLDRTKAILEQPAE